MSLLIAAITPAILIMYLVYRHDLEKEPIKMLVKAFFGGVLSIGIALLIALPLSLLESFVPSGFIRSFYTSFFCAGIPEEFAKWLIFYWFISKAKDFDQYYDGILYAIFISMGFAMVENVLYVADGGIVVAISRAITAVPAHMLFAIPMGYFLSLSKFYQGKESTKNTILSLLVPILLHGIYDFILFYAGAKVELNPLLFILLVIAFVIFNIFMWRLGLRKIKAHIAKDRVNQQNQVVENEN